MIDDLMKHMFGVPRGVLGRMGGRFMARMNADCGAWVAGHLHIRVDDKVLEVGFGPGVIIQHLAALAQAGRVAGIDLSKEMVAQASARNAPAIEKGVVDLHHGSVDSLPFADDTFDKVLTVNSMQLWPDRIRGLRQLLRVMKPRAILAVGFTPYSGQKKNGVTEVLVEAGFIEPQLKEFKSCFCAVVMKP